jgi:hypothetical protein
MTVSWQQVSRRPPVHSGGRRAFVIDFGIAGLHSERERWSIGRLMDSALPQRSPRRRWSV